MRINQLKACRSALYLDNNLPGTQLQKIRAQQHVQPYSLLSAFIREQIISYKNNIRIYLTKRLTFKDNNLLWLAIFATNCCDNYMTCLGSITVNHSCFHFLKNHKTFSFQVNNIATKQSTSGGWWTWRQSQFSGDGSLCTLSSLIFMSFISSGNLSTPAEFPLLSRNPVAGTTLTEAILSKKESNKEDPLRNSPCRLNQDSATYLCIRLITVSCFM